MKLTLFFLINIIFSDSLSNWMDANNHIIDSKSYKISFKQKIESIIAGESHYILDTNTNVVFFENQIRYESSDRIIVANKDSIKLLNKSNNQLFIDYTDNQLSFLFQFSLSEILNDDNIFEPYEDYFRINSKNFIDSKVYFKNNEIDVIKVVADNMNIELFNIVLEPLDTLIMYKYFDIDFSRPSAIFDLRSK